MARPFALTLEARRGDGHRLWLSVLGYIGLAFLAWGHWLLTAPIEIVVRSDRVIDTGRHLTEQVEVRKRASIRYVQQTRRLISARFPAGERERLAAGQRARVILENAAGQQLLPVGAELRSLSVQPNPAYIEALLALDSPERPDWATARPQRVEVIVDHLTPLAVLRQGWPER